jgi:hypothetical protein
MPHDRLFHDALFILLGVTWIVFSLRRDRWLANATAINQLPAPKPRRARIIGVSLGLLNIFVALMDILHTPGAMH